MHSESEEQNEVVRKMKYSELRLKCSCAVFLKALWCEKRFLLNEVCTNLKRNNWSSISWQRAELRLSPKRERTDPYISGNDESGYVDSAIAVFVLSVKI